MDLKYLLLKQDVKLKKIVVESINTDLQVADIFTKGLPPKTFKDILIAWVLQIVPNYLLIMPFILYLSRHKNY